MRTNNIQTVCFARHYANIAIAICCWMYYSTNISFCRSSIACPFHPTENHFLVRTNASPKDVHFVAMMRFCFSRLFFCNSQIVCMFLYFQLFFAETELRFVRNFFDWRMCEWTRTDLLICDAVCRFYSDIIASDFLFYDARTADICDT